MDKLISKTPMITTDYFTEDGLVKQVGLSSDWWENIVIKELIDNALDAVEPLPEKNVEINYSNGNFSVFDNGSGIPKEIVKDIYDFGNYVSHNRDYITASRGKQGNGLKTIIGICYLRTYHLFWHTADGIIIEAKINPDELVNGKIEAEFVEHGTTEKRGIEIKNFKTRSNVSTSTWDYAQCNPDVTFFTNGQKIVESTKPCVDKSQGISIAYYDYLSYRNLVTHQPDKTITYKQFLGDVFGTVVKNKSMIKGRIQDIDLKSDAFIEDFLMLKEFQKTKRYTLLKNHLIGLDKNIQTTVQISDKNAPKGENDKIIPCIVEFSVKKRCSYREAANSYVGINCYINNSITYWPGGYSIQFSQRVCTINGRRESCSNLQELLAGLKNFSFTFHIVSPYLKYTDAGKTRIDVSSFIDELVEALDKAIAKENRNFNSGAKKPSLREQMREYLTDAFMIASSNARYAITARQIWYKLREISSIIETKNTYADFTQTILTEWLESYPQYEGLVNFSERGNFYVDGRQQGLGSANVRNFISSIGSAPDAFECYGGISSDIYIQPHFNIQYKYDKVLYIEKTGFDAIFRAEKIDEKYSMIIVSGQGFVSRSAKQFLYNCQQQGMRLYCMHDLDISGCLILDSLKNPNEKFKESLEVIDLGVTLKDVERYRIQPEIIDLSKEDKSKLENLPKEYQKFFGFVGDKGLRVELNAFTTEQILEIIDQKLASINELPTIDLQSAFKLDHQAIKETALVNLIKKKFLKAIDDIYVPLDLSTYEGQYTVKDAQKKLPEIQEAFVKQYEDEISKLNIFGESA